LDQPSVLLEDPERAALFFKPDLTAPADVALEQGVQRYHTRRATASLVWPFPDHGLAGRIHRVTCPVALVWGERDRFNPITNVDLYAAALAGHTGTTTITGAGHCLEWDAPAEAVAAVEALL